jgi:nitrite reductase (NADH) large subunit
VSGCARECAEARSKDFGLIATEKGWNLYVGGNGGANPVHARLLAGDLDAQTVVRYLDRYLMYYIRTADRLQRTAPWIDALDGGLDRVREVVVDDVLGLGTELEVAMARHVENYSDEWRATLEDPDKLRRFVSFVNAPDVPDPQISVRSERGQHVPGEPTGPVTLGTAIPVGPPR